MTRAPKVKIARLEWPDAVRIIRSAFPPIDLFEDIADPADWPLLISAEQKTNPRLMTTIGNLDLVPPDRRVGGPGASYIMAPFTHISTDRQSRFSDGSFGVLYAGRVYETALFETMHHHGRFMSRTAEAPGWTSQFREILLDIDASVADLRGTNDAALSPDDYAAGQALAIALKRAEHEGIAYPSIRHRGGECCALFFPDGASRARQGRHLDYHWNGERVDLVRDHGTGAIFRVIDNE